VADTPAVSYAPTDELELIRTTARQFLEERLPSPVVRELMVSEEGFDAAVWKDMAGMGWTGLTIAEEQGGSGFGPVELGVLLEEMGRMVTPGPFFASTVVATTAIQETASPEQCSDLLPDLASGETLAALALFEGPRSWSLENPLTSATRSDDGWIINGSKRSVLGGTGADLLLVLAATDDGVSLFAVPSDLDGVQITPEPVLDPTRRQASVVLDSVRVEDRARLGGGDATAALQRTLALSVAYLACEQAGGAQRCLDMAVNYAKSRHQFGRPIGSFQAIKHRCAQMLMKVEHARSVAYHAVRVAGDSDELAVAAPLAGSVASEAYVWVAGENIQVHGGIGFTWEHDAHIYLKRAKASSLLFGDPGYQRHLLGRAIGI
jgi:alkylation response protein AidB-like acyl-CoA dehydrogenase